MNRPSRGKGEFDHIGQDASRGSPNPGACALDDEGLLVPLGVDLHQVVRPLEPPEGGVRTDQGRGHHQLSSRTVHRGGISEDLSLGFGGLDLFRVALVEARQRGHEVGHAHRPAVAELRREERLHLDILQLELPAHAASQDEGLAGNVNAAEVVSWVGLGVAQLLGLGDHLGEGPPGLQPGHHEPEGPAKGAQNLGDGILGGHGTGQGGDYGQAGPDRGLEAAGPEALEPRVRVGGELIVDGLLHCEGLLVRRAHLELLAHGSQQRRDRVRGRGAVHDHYLGDGGPLLGLTHHRD
mmetsp:Transcript_58383/g.132212  ORF Transcript_58383/g.132212 Transcript_58383/m.132212 type:complete len:295 (+) Transcript_58383:83-967(+)